MQHAGRAVRLQRHDRRDLAARARRPAGAVPAEHRHRRDAHPARQRRRRRSRCCRSCSPRSGRASTGRASAREERASRGWTAWARLVVRRRWTAAIASTAVLAALDRRRRLDPARQPAGRLARAGGRRPRRARAARAVGHRHRPAVAVRRAGALGRSRRRRRGRSPGSRASGRDVAPADWRRDGAALVTVIPTAEGNSPAGRETLDRIRAATRASMPADVVTGGEAAQSADFLDAVYGNFPLVDRPDLRPHVRPARPRVPLAGAPAQGGAAEPALGRRGLGPDGARLAARMGLRGRSGASRRRGAINVEMPIVDLRVPVRHLDGLPGVHPQPDARGLRPHGLDRRRGRRGHRPHRPAGDQRGADPRPRVRRHERRPRARRPRCSRPRWAAGILLDATLIRGVLAPAVVALLGRWNWWLPGPAARILRVAPPHDVARQPAPASA